MAFIGRLPVVVEQVDVHLFIDYCSVVVGLDVAMMKYCGVCVHRFRVLMSWLVIEERLEPAQECSLLYCILYIDDIAWWVT